MDSTKSRFAQSKLVLAKKIFFLFFMSFPIIGFTQDLERKGKFFFNVGPEYRITPVYKLNNYSREASYTNVDMQNSGVSLNLGVDYYVTHNLSIGFKNSFRYDLLTAQDTQVGSNQEISNTKKGFLVGYHFKLIYHFEIFKKGDLLIGAGISLLNRNSEFTNQEQVFDDNGELVGTITSLVDYKYGANKLSLGYANGKSKVMLGMYITRNSGYFEETTTFMVPFINYSFDFGRL